MSIEPIPKTSLVETVVSRIYDLIEKGALQPGDRLPTETELTERCGVSRTVVREAVSHLASQGMLVVKRGRGTYVGDWSHISSCVRLICSALTVAPKELLQFNEFREGLECLAARRAAELATPTDLAELETLCDDIDREGNTVAESMEFDFQFHRRLMTICGNPLMQNVLEMVHEYIIASMRNLPYDRNHSRWIHRTILDAVRSRDPEAAEKAMRTHMKYTHRVAEKLSRADERSTA